MARPSVGGRPGKAPGPVARDSRFLVDHGTGRRRLAAREPGDEAVEERLLLVFDGVFGRFGSRIGDQRRRLHRPQRGEQVLVLVLRLVEQDVDADRPGAHRVEIAQRAGQQAAIERRALACGDQRLVGVDRHAPAAGPARRARRAGRRASRRGRARPRRLTGRYQLNRASSSAPTSSSAVSVSRRAPASRRVRQPRARIRRRLAPRHHGSPRHARAGGKPARSAGARQARRRAGRPRG